MEDIESLLDWARPGHRITLDAFYCSYDKERDIHAVVLPGAGVEGDLRLLIDNDTMDGILNLPYHCFCPDCGASINKTTDTGA